MDKEPESVYRMDISEETNASHGILEEIPDEDSRCNWDIEIIQFVVDSFIRMFPENGGSGTRRTRQDARGEFATSSCRPCHFSSAPNVPGKAHSCNVVIDANFTVLQVG